MIPSRGKWLTTHFYPNLSKIFSFTNLFKTKPTYFIENVIDQQSIFLRWLNTKVEYHYQISGFHKHVVHVETNARWRSAPKSKQLKMEENMRNGISEYSNAKCWCQINGFPNESTVQFTTQENTNDSAFSILLRLNSKGWSFDFNLSLFPGKFTLSVSRESDLEEFFLFSFGNFFNSYIAFRVFDVIPFCQLGKKMSRSSLQWRVR